MIINLPKSLTLSHSGPAKICGNRRPTFRTADCVLITQAREMPEDKELRRLKEVERLARERFLRLSLPGTFGGMPMSLKPQKTYGGKRLRPCARTGTNDG